jgi:hypothetical protein
MTPDEEELRLLAHLFAAKCTEMGLRNVTFLFHERDRLSIGLHERATVRFYLEDESAPLFYNPLMQTEAVEV